MKGIMTICAFMMCLQSGISYARQAESIDPSVRSGRYTSTHAWQGQAWRIRILDAAIVQGDTVYFGNVAEPLGDIPADVWQDLAQKPLWATPPQVGKPFQINKKRLKEALQQQLGMIADSCILPNSLAIQKGGAVLYADDLRSMAVKSLTPQINRLGGRSDMIDFRLPPYIFLGHVSQSLVLEPTDVRPGRMNLQFALQEPDGSIVRRFSGSTFLNVWVNAPSVARPLGKGATVMPGDIVHKSVNLAYEKGELWDGRGGPWQVVRPIGAMQPIAASDLEPKATVQKGQKLKLLYNKGNIRVTALVEAMEDGALGELILVRNLDSKKQIYGMVHDANTVIAK